MEVERSREKLGEGNRLVAIISLRKPEAVKSCIGVVAGVRIGERWCGKHCGQPIYGARG